MRHDWLHHRDRFDIVDVAAVWPRGDGGVQAPLGQIEACAPPAPAPAPAVPDMPVAVGRTIVGIYIGIIAAFALTMAKGGQASFMISISAFYVAIFLTVPRLFLAVEADESRRPSWREFLSRGMDTQTGHTSGRAALVQILIVPVLLLTAISAMGLTALMVLP
jgi:ABC-type amino acid transport system permease subunit